MPLQVSSLGPCPPMQASWVPMHCMTPGTQAPTPLMPGPQGPPMLKPSSISPSQSLSTPSQATSVVGVSAPRQAPQVPALQVRTPVWQAPLHVHSDMGAAPQLDTLLLSSQPLMPSG
jgi:hypothetical protein